MHTIIGCGISRSQRSEHYGTEQNATLNCLQVTSASMGWGSASAQLTDGFSFDTANGPYEEGCIFGEKKVLMLAGQTTVLHTYLPY